MRCIAVPTVHSSNYAIEALHFNVYRGSFPRGIAVLARCWLRLWPRFKNSAALTTSSLVYPSWNVMAHGDAREGNWSGNTTSEHGESSITTADAHTSAASSRLNWRPRRFKWTRPFRRKKKSGFCACAITFQLASTGTSLFCLLPSAFSIDPWESLTRSLAHPAIVFLVRNCFGKILRFFR